MPLIGKSKSRNYLSTFNWDRCRLWSVNDSSSVSFCFNLFPSSRFCDWRLRDRICHTRTSSACEFKSCGNSAPVPSYRCSAESCRLCIVRKRRFSFSSSCNGNVSNGFVHSTTFLSRSHHHHSWLKTYTNMTVSIAQLILYRSQTIQTSRCNPLSHFTNRFVYGTLTK